MSYLGVLLLLGVLILIHEIGHLVAARAVGIPVASFAVGFGPKVWSRRRGRTEYSLRALPLGGFVLPDVDEESGLHAFALRKRLVFFLGGPLANLAAAVPLFAVLNTMEHGLSARAVLAAPLQVAVACWKVLSVIPTLFSQPELLQGVVGIVAEGGRMGGAVDLVLLAISLSVSLAVLNLLPIPVLDGGQILTHCLEEAFPPLVRLRAPLTMLGLAVLAALLVYANVQDVMRHWG